MAVESTGSNLFFQKHMVKKSKVSHFGLQRSSRPYLGVQSEGGWKNPIDSFGDSSVLLGTRIKSGKVYSKNTPCGK